MNPKAAQRIPDVLLERFRLGEVSQAEDELLRSRLQSESELNARLQSLEASDAGLRLQLESLRDAVRRKAAGTAPVAATRRRPVPAAATLAAAAAVLVLALLPVLRRDPRIEETRLKGADSGLVVYRKTGGGSQALADGARAHKGDLIQLAYRSSERRFGVIASIDGAGRVTLHFPAEGALAAPLADGRLTPVDFAYQLDDAPRFERFYLVTADAPFDVARVRAALGAAHSRHAAGAAPRLELPAGYAQFVLTLNKENDR